MSKFEKDFKYFLKFLKNNTSNFAKIDDEALYRTTIERVKFIRTEQGFTNFLLGFIHLHFPPQIYGHLGTRGNLTTKEDIKQNDGPLGELMKQMKIVDERPKRITEKPERLFYPSIIKNNKNENVMYIKVPTFNNYINPDPELIALSKFIKRHKNLKDCYIDIRGNGGGNPYIVEKLLSILSQDYFSFKKNDVPMYFKAPKILKPFVEGYLNGDCIVSKVGDMYKVVAHLESVSFLDTDLYAGFTGNVFIIMDGGCFSSAQILLDYTQGNKRFTILGNEMSAGSGIIGHCVDCNPHYCFFLLPETKFLMYFDFFMTKENVKTIPDKPIPRWLI